MARPQFKPTVRQRNQVKLSAMMGMAEDVMAEALGISRTTLRKHFDWEMTVGASLELMSVYEDARKSAKKGSVGAQKLLIDKAQSGKPSFIPPLDESKPKAPKLGKKDQANADAHTAQVGTTWDTILPASPRAN